MNRRLLSEAGQILWPAEGERKGLRRTATLLGGLTLLTAGAVGQSVVRRVRHAHRAKDAVFGPESADLTSNGQAGEATTSEDATHGVSDGSAQGKTPGTSEDAGMIATAGDAVVAQEGAEPSQSLPPAAEGEWPGNL